MNKKKLKYITKNHSYHPLYNEFYMKLYTIIFEFNIKYEKLKKRKNEFNIYNNYTKLENNINIYYPIIYKCINLPMRKNILYKDSIIEMQNIVNFINKLQSYIFNIDILLN
tara:strand:+ start:640 stop:972 length:333 start_codon:yes stop_codon:yes gene_type:complete